MKNYLISLLSVLLVLSVIQAKGAPTEKIIIKTSAQCGMCQANIDKEFTFTKGIKSFELNKENGDVTVVYNPDKTDPDKIRKAISRAGYDADDVPADPKAYEKLDDCCKKGAHRDG